ncbi:MAG: 4-hydroxybenzoate octaprenyltransferase [Zoogloeaceae bacterium]|nr:4-hydroxybenzoate octaprenyltransferase [Zoogloeaceae bacterium]
MSFAARLPHYAHLIRIDKIDKQAGTMFLVWPTLWALWMAAEGHPSPWLVFIFAFGSFLMHSSGCIINDFCDRDVDPHVKRTCDRPLATGVLSVKEAMWFAVGILAVAFALVLSLNNPLVVWWAVAALLVTLVYPLTKRFLPIPQAFLGFAFGFGMPMAYAAVQSHVPPLVWLLMVGNLFWTIAYDTAYAMCDRDDDEKLGFVMSSAMTFGKKEVAAVMLSYALFFSLTTAAALLSGLGWPFLLGMGGACGFALYNYTLIRTRERAACWRAFVNTNWVGACIFGGVVLDYLVR